MAILIVQYCTKWNNIGDAVVARACSASRTLCVFGRQSERLTFGMEEPTMKKSTRRDFLKQSALATGALAAAGRLAIAEDAASPVDMCIAKWEGDPDALTELATRLTEEAIEAIGGMGRFVNQGDVIWVKPNIAWDHSPEYAANTNPDVVKTLVRLCFDAGARQVKVGDNPCHQWERTYRNSGIADAAREAGADVIHVDRSRFRDMEIGGGRLQTHPVYPEIVESDLVINVPVAKHHGSTTVTLCMKNYMGVVENRGVFHQDLPSCIRDITAFMKPRISVLDAIRVLTANGPTGGNLDDVRRMDTVAAGTDVVALDAFGCELLGHDPHTIDTVTYGHEAGLGEIDFRDKLNVREMTIS